MSSKNNEESLQEKIFDFFQRFYVINLPSRSDRRQAVLSDLASAGVLANDPKLRIFSAMRPGDQGDFPSIGARGCYMSHLGVLKEALAQGLENVVIIEDDLILEPPSLRSQPQLLKTLREENWDIAYLGHIENYENPNALPAWKITDQPLVCAHFIAFNGKVIPAIVSFLEACLKRPEGHPDGGPMHVDGAYNVFRKLNPEIKTLICMPSLGGQRSSRSDIYSNKWFDRLPVFRQTVGLVRRFINFFRRLQRFSQQKD